MPLISISDPLYCSESPSNLNIHDNLTPCALDHFIFPTPTSKTHWLDMLHSLTSKQLQTNATVDDTMTCSYYLKYARKHAVNWLLCTASHLGFAPLTSVLAVNYLDRCFVHENMQLHEDKPWMGRLAAVACLSLAAKVEETCVPVILDLQLVDSCVFEPKTVRRMELLVLSKLGWRMNPVTALSFVEHLALWFCGDLGAAESTAEFVRCCEVALMSVIHDSRWVSYLPSVWAAAAMLNAMEQSNFGFETIKVHQDIALLNAPMAQVQECRRIMHESNVIDNGKRKHSLSPSPPSPCGVIGSCFSYDCYSSNGDSFAMWPASVSSSPEIRPTKMPCIENNK